jgi:hypothetical protein
MYFNDSISRWNGVLVNSPINLSPFGWKIVFRQTILDDNGTYTYWPSGDIIPNQNIEDPTNANYSILENIDGLRYDGTKYRFKIFSPEDDSEVIWEQTSNPVTTYESVDNYVYISGTNNHGFAGLSKSSRGATHLDGSPNPNITDWWHAIGVKNPEYNKSIPLFVSTNISELYIWTYTNNPTNHCRYVNHITLDSNGNIVHQTRQFKRSSKPISLIFDRPGGYINTCKTTFTNNDIIKNVNNNEPCNSVKRVRGASTLITQNYYSSSKQYIQSRCKSFDKHQRKSTNSVYEPNNDKFSTQGAVSSSNYISNLAYNANME